MPETLPHLQIKSFFSAKQYVYPKQSGGSIEIKKRNRTMHGNKIIEQLNLIRTEFNLQREQELPQNIVRDDVLYVEFISEWDFSLDFKRFHEEKDDPKFQLVNIKQEIGKEGNETNERFRVLVMMREGAVSAFLKKARQYLTENTKDHQRNDTGLPVHRTLVNNIAEIELATIKSFWSDGPEIPFPQEDQVLWWEVWFRKTDDDLHRMERVIQNLLSTGARLGQGTLSFPEHTVKLIKASARQLSQSVVLLDNLSELRKPQQLNDFITSSSVDIPEKHVWLNDLVARTNKDIDPDGVVVCLLDSGVNNKHPLLQKILPNDKLFTFKDSWGTEDSFEGGGHGTAMGGLTLYGDLSQALAVSGQITIRHELESFKIIHPADPNDPPFYGAITEYACSMPFTIYPNNLRIFCLSVTDKQQALNGKPSTWSAAIDRIAFREQGSNKAHLFILSSGNVDYLMPQCPPTAYPDKNLLESVHDPAQSYNALTVGTYTRMNRIDQTVFPGISALAVNGGMAPSNSTSLTWQDQWPIKPDIVMEGGNLAVQAHTIRDHVHTLKPLSLDKDFQKYILCPFGETSGAAALAAKFAAELQTAYPNYWPETIRGLIVHSADWTAAMKNGINLNNVNQAQKRQLLRSFGYGTPIMHKAVRCANNSLTLIAENYIQPFRVEGDKVKTNEYHLYTIPWPVKTLQQELGDKDVTIKVTLSYFIDPNPGNRRYANNFSYHSHALDFKMIGPTESIPAFKRRVSAAEENLEIPFDGHSEPWLLKEKLRNRGSIKKDILICSGADLALRNIIAIYPKHGWYSLRKRLGKVDSVVRYTLIISIETEELNIDIYNPVLQIIKNTVII